MFRTKTNRNAHIQMNHTLLLWRGDFGFGSELGSPLALTRSEIPSIHFFYLAVYGTAAQAGPCSQSETTKRLPLSATEPITAFRLARVTTYTPFALSARVPTRPATI